MSVVETLIRFLGPPAREQSALSSERQLRRGAEEKLAGRGIRRVYKNDPDPNGYGRQDRIQAWTYIQQRPHELVTITWEFLSLKHEGEVMVCQTEITLGDTEGSEPTITVRDRKHKPGTESEYELVAREVRDFKEKDALMRRVASILITGKPQDEMDPIVYNSVPRPPA